MAGDFERSVAFMQRLGRRLADRHEPFARGEAWFNERLPLVWDLNYLMVREPHDVAAADLAGEAERLHRDAGHQHRKVAVDDEAAGRRLEPDFEALGWEKEALLVMAKRRAADPEIDTSFVREVSEAELQPMRERGIRSQPWFEDDEALEQMLASYFLTDGAARVRRFAAFADGMPVSHCDLYSAGGTAQVETVATLEDYRNRGLARAVVTRALAAAQAQGDDFVFLVADAGDWPKELYRKLGFDDVGLVLRFQITLNTVVERLLAESGASRVTLRRDRPGDSFFPVTHEALAEGVASIREESSIDLRGQPVVRRLEETRTQVVQDDCASASDNPDFHRMREAYGGLAAQIVTPLVADDRLVGVLSLHQCGAPRVWSQREQRLAAEAASRALGLLRANRDS